MVGAIASEAATDASLLSFVPVSVSIPAYAGSARTKLLTDCAWAMALKLLVLDLDLLIDGSGGNKYRGIIYRHA